MRAFIAVELSQEIKSYLTKLQKEIQTSGADLTLVKPDNIHLTLRFLGEIDENLAERVSLALKDAATTNEVFNLTLGNVGAFPNITTSRIIWVGIVDGENQIKEITNNIEGKIRELGIAKEEKTFSAHITIARVKSAKNIEKLSAILQKLSIQKPPAELNYSVSEITFFRSTLTPQGPVYEKLQEFPLNN